MSCKKTISHPVKIERRGDRMTKKDGYRYSGSVTIGNKSKLAEFRKYFKRKGFKVKTRKSGDQIDVYYKRK